MNGNPGSVCLAVMQHPQWCGQEDGKCHQPQGSPMAVPALVECMAMTALHHPMGIQEDQQGRKSTWKLTLLLISIGNFCGDTGKTGKKSQDFFHSPHNARHQEHLHLWLSQTAMCVSPGKGGTRGKSTHLQSMWWSRMRKTPKARLVNLSGRVLQVELFQYIAILKVFCKIHVFHLPNGSTSWLKYA